MGMLMEPQFKSVHFATYSFTRGIFKSWCNFDIEIECWTHQKYLNNAINIIFRKALSKFYCRTIDLNF